MKYKEKFESAKLEEQLGYKFQDLELLKRALTHRSWAHERSASGREEKVRHLHNEALEFIGDSVLGLAIAESLFKNFPNLSEGELSLMKHRLVSATSLAQLADKLNLSIYLQMGRGEEKTGGRHKQAILADAMEALMAAIFLDGGYLAAKDFVVRVFSEDLRTITPTSSIDYKTLLQERLQANHRLAPTYTVVRTEGPPHDRTFFVQAKWDSGEVEGHGTSIKNAAMMAAKYALEMLNVKVQSGKE